MPSAESSVTVPVSPPRFHCDMFPERDRVRVAPAGELDIATAPQLERTIRELLSSGFDHIVVDLAGVEFLDSTGLRLILSLHAAAAADGYRFRLRPGPPAVQRLFELTGTLDLVDFEARVRPIRIVH
jgi:anti-sigma B factor antagonist